MHNIQKYCIYRTNKLDPPKKPVFEKEGGRVIVLKKDPPLFVYRERERERKALKFKRKMSMYCM